MIPVSERYQRDATFRNFVDTIYHYMETLELTPNEMREAVMFAAVKFEALNIKPILMTHEEMKKYREMYEIYPQKPSQETNFYPRETGK